MEQKINVHWSWFTRIVTILVSLVFARIIWEIGEFLIPPFQKIISKDGSYKFPLREICELKNNSSGNPICYYLPFDDKKKYLHKIN